MKILERIIRLQITRCEEMSTKATEWKKRFFWVGNLHKVDEYSEVKDCWDYLRHCYLKELLRLQLKDFNRG